MNWSPQQEDALRKVEAWLNDPHKKQFFRLDGFAGTGKTTLAKHFAESVNGPVLRLATDIREGRARIEHMSLEEADNDVDQWLVGMNTTRGAMNDVLRRALMGDRGPLPQVALHGRDPRCEGSEAV